MAALNAIQVRRESRALRTESRRLRGEARIGVRLSRHRLETCLLTFARTSDLGAATKRRRSPWSELEWEPAVAADLDHVLVPL